MTERKRKAIDLIRNEPARFGIMVGFKDLNQLHNDWLKEFLFSKDDQTKLAHRGSYKTTTGALFLALHILLKPNETTLFFRKTDTDVNEVIKTTANIMRTGAYNELVRTIYGIDLVIWKETTAEIDTNLYTGMRGQSQIQGLGIGASVTGKHGDVVMTDDIVNIKDRISKAERERTKTMYMELENVKNRGGRFINTGTPWHKEDAISIMPNVERFDCYSTGLMSNDQIKTMRQRMSDSLFAANYELKHITDEKALFRDPKFEKDATMLYGGRGHIDAAYGGADFTAYTEMNERDGRIIAFGKLWSRHVDDCLPVIQNIHEDHRIGSVACETNGDKGYLAKEMKLLGLPVRKYAERTNKFIKISSYLRKNWDRIYWLEDTDPEYLSQILDYTEFAEHDDSPDSAASLLRDMEKQETPTIATIQGGI